MTVGLLGGGQLGRMLALAGYTLGLRFRVLDPTADVPAGQVAPLMRDAYEDVRALERFVHGLRAVTYEFENVPIDTARYLAARAPVFPPPAALEAAQDRLHEKSLFAGLGIPTPEFAAIDSRADLVDVIERIGLPAVLKTRRFGYDGKGQRVLRGKEDIAPAWGALGGVPLLLEECVSFDRELSVLAVRSGSGQTAFYPLVENHHEDGILRLSIAPAPGLTGALQAEAESYAIRVLEKLDYVGVLAIELFQADGRLLANEMAPRVHNSGHWTIEGAETSQFENHLRAGLGWPLGSTAARGASAMLNLIGVVPDAAALLTAAGAHLHLYDKAPRVGRKLGHLTLRGDDPTVVAAQVEQLRPLICTTR